jgi:hypothetical protein
MCAVAPKEKKSLWMIMTIMMIVMISLRKVMKLWEGLIAFSPLIRKGENNASKVCIHCRGNVPLLRKDKGLSGVLGTHRHT